MSTRSDPEAGTVTWTDLTVEDAEIIRDFYSAVIGWTPAPVNMQGYKDFNMLTPASGEIAAGICHARGANAGLPAQWLIYITVDDLDKSLARCQELGGRVLYEPGPPGGLGRFGVIQDPAGAVAALFEPAE